jgi:hypothetical protein
VTNFTNGLAGAQAAGKVITDTVASLSQETRQQIADAFNKFNEGTSLVEPTDRLSGSAIGILEGLGILPNVQIADSGSSSGFTPLTEVLDNNPSQAFQESRQAGNVIGFGLPLVLEGGGVGKPPASSPELVPVGPGVRFPVENPAPLVRAPETGPLETRVEDNQGPLQSRNEDPNGNTVEGAGDTPLLSADNALSKVVEQVKLGGDNLLETTIETKSGPVGTLAEVGIEGNTLTLNNLSIFQNPGADVSRATILQDLLATRSQLIDAARSQGFDTLRITGQRSLRSSSANPGKDIDITIDLRK